MQSFLVQFLADQSLFTVQTSFQPTVAFHIAIFIRVSGVSRTKQEAGVEQGWEEQVSHPAPSVSFCVQFFIPCCLGLVPYTQSTQP